MINDKWIRCDDRYGIIMIWMMNEIWMNEWMME